MFNVVYIKCKYLMADCYICHAFGKLFSKTANLLKSYSDKAFKINDNISIISPMNKGCYDKSTLVKQCNISNIELLQSEKVFHINSLEWSNLLKIEAIIELLEKVNTEYVIILDGKDTCILKDLDDTFINKFKEYNADIVYNSMPSKYPMVKVETREFLEENHFRYINAGLCIGYRDKLLEFYKECLNNINDTVLGYDNKPSEQYVIRKTAVCSKIKVKCDYNLTLFNTPTRKEIKENSL